MNTLDPQLIHSLINSIALLASFVILAYAIQLVRKTRQQTPSESLVFELRAEVERFSGMVADLEERFSRFQKREGMRAARAEKTAQKDLQAEAAELVASASGNQALPGSSPKAQLYAKLRGH